MPVFCLMLLCTNAQGQQTSPTDTSHNNSTVTADGKVFNKVEIEAEFPGGTQAWGNYLRQNLHANVPVKKKAPAGTYTVVIRFIVSANGSITDVVAETNHGYGMENEVMRIIKKGPKWLPAQQGGKNVNAYRRQPVTFAVIQQ